MYGRRADSARAPDAVVREAAAHLARSDRAASCAACASRERSLRSSPWRLEDRRAASSPSRAARSTWPTGAGEAAARGARIGGGSSRSAILQRSVGRALLTGWEPGSDRGRGEWRRAGAPGRPVSPLPRACAWPRPQRAAGRTTARQLPALCRRTAISARGRRATQSQAVGRNEACQSMSAERWLQAPRRPALEARVGSNTRSLTKLKRQLHTYTTTHKDYSRSSLALASAGAVAGPQRLVGGNVQAFEQGRCAPGAAHAGEPVAALRRRRDPNIACAVVSSTAPACALAGPSAPQVRKLLDSENVTQSNLARFCDVT